MTVETHYICEYCKNKFSDAKACEAHENNCADKKRKEQREKYHLRSGKCCATYMYSSVNQESGWWCTIIKELRPSRYFQGDVSPTTICDLYENKFELRGDKLVEVEE